MFRPLAALAATRLPAGLLLVGSLACLRSARSFTGPPAQPGIAAPARSAGPGVFAGARARTLVLYDTTGPWGFLGELYAQQTANLVSHFGAWQAEPVAAYTAGQMAAFTAVIYLGSTYDEPLPGAFLADVRAGSRPVIWAGANLWQLTAAQDGFARGLGWTLGGYERSPVSWVTYKGCRFERTVPVPAGVLQAVLADPRKAQVLATAARADGTGLPWALRSGKLTFITEIPLSYLGPNDRYLVFADLLFDALAPATRPRHRALVRLEDVGPDADPAQLRALADVLAARKVPFAVAVYPAYRDPLGAHHRRERTALDLAAAPALVQALAYLQARGGTLVMHGYTHQFGEAANPYSGASADDFEFFRAHVDPGDSVVLDGPVPGDSRAWAAARLRAGLTAFKDSGLAPPAIFEFPHYAGSAEDYQAVQAVFGIRYDRGTYYSGWFDGRSPDYRNHADQYFPYPVRDVYGSLVIPENLGNVITTGYNNTDARLPADLLQTAACNLAVRDGFASFFYHPRLGPAPLAQLLDGLRAQGWTFVSAPSVLAP